VGWPLVTVRIITFVATGVGTRTGFHLWGFSARGMATISRHRNHGIRLRAYLLTGTSLQEVIPSESPCPAGMALENVSSGCGRQKANQPVQDADGSP
jgi:hypothetical protein